MKHNVVVKQITVQRPPLMFPTLPWLAQRVVTVDGVPHVFQGAGATGYDAIADCALNMDTFVQNLQSSSSDEFESTELPF